MIYNIYLIPISNSLVYFTVTWEVFESTIWQKLFTYLILTLFKIIWNGGCMYVMQTLNYFLPFTEQSATSTREGTRINQRTKEGEFGLSTCFPRFSIFIDIYKTI